MLGSYARHEVKFSQQEAWAEGSLRVNRVLIEQQKCRDFNGCYRLGRVIFPKLVPSSVVADCRSILRSTRY